MTHWCMLQKVYTSARGVQALKAIPRPPPNTPALPLPLNTVTPPHPTPRTLSYAQLHHENQCCTPHPQSNHLQTFVAFTPTTYANTHLHTKTNIHPRSVCKNTQIYPKSVCRALPPP
jgi:hypothetical protein